MGNCTPDGVGLSNSPNCVIWELAYLIGRIQLLRHIEDVTVYCLFLYYVQYTTLAKNFTEP
jgi:hypothetical protein